MKSKLFIGKGQQRVYIVRAKVWLTTNFSDGGYNHARISLKYDTHWGEEEFVSLRYQRHLLDYQPYGDISRIYESNTPSKRFDYGSRPMSAFYAGKIDTDIGIENLDKGQRILNLLEKIRDYVRENRVIREVEPNDDLAQLVVALEMLGVDVVVDYHGDNGQRGVGAAFVAQKLAEQKVS